MGKPFDDIKKRINASVDSALQKDWGIEPKHELPVDNDGPIRFFDIEIAGNSIVVTPRVFKNTAGESASDIIGRFLATGDLPSEGFVEDPDNPDPILVLGLDEDDYLINGKPGPSQLDLAIRGPEAFLFRLSINSLFVDPKTLSFTDPKFHKHYGNCNFSSDGKRFAFAAKGDPRHFDSLWIDRENKIEQRHKFNIHLVLTDPSDAIPTDDRYLTRIIFDPKARDGGAPPPGP